MNIENSTKNHDNNSVLSDNHSEPQDDNDGSERNNNNDAAPKDPEGIDPTRFGDWQHNGRCTDF